MASPHVLLYTRAIGFVHPNMDVAVAALSSELDVVWSEDPQSLHDLSSYDVVAFCNTSGEAVDEAGRGALQSYIDSGRGFAGIHGATACCDEWDWYGHMIGARFASHPAGVHEAQVTVDTSHPSTAHLPRTWTWRDEWYCFDRAPSGFTVLATIEPAVNGAGSTEPQAVVWHRDNVWYTALGHDGVMYRDEAYLRHLVEGIRSVA